MGKKAIIAVVAVLAALALFFGICLAVADYDHPEYAGGYESIGDADSVYDMYLDEDGTFEIVDVGAGNPAIKGKMAKLPFGKNKYVLNCLHDEDFDGWYLHVRFRISVCDVKFAKTDDEYSSGRKAITIRHGKERMEFWRGE